MPRLTALVETKRADLRKRTDRLKYLQSLQADQCNQRLLAVTEKLVSPGPYFIGLYEMALPQLKNLAVEDSGGFKYVTNDDEPFELRTFSLESLGYGDGTDLANLTSWMLYNRVYRIVGTEYQKQLKRKW